MRMWSMVRAAGRTTCHHEGPVSLRVWKTEPLPKVPLRLPSLPSAAMEPKPSDEAVAVPERAKLTRAAPAMEAGRKASRRSSRRVMGIELAESMPDACAPVTGGFVQSGEVRGPYLMEPWNALRRLKE